MAYIILSWSMMEGITSERRILTKKGKLTVQRS